MYLHHRVQQQLVAGAIEVAAPVQQAFVDGQRLGQPGFKRRPHARDQRLHGRVGRQHVGKHRQQPVAVVGHAAAAHLKIQHAQKLAVGAGVGDQGLAAAVADDAGHRHAVMGVAAQDGVDAGDAAGEFEVHIHAVVRQQHHHLCALGTRLGHGFLQVVFLDAEGPVGHHVARVGDWCVRKGLTDDGAGHAVERAHDKGLEHRVAEIIGLDVLRNEIDLARQLFFDNLGHPVHAQGELPVAGHQVDAQQLAGLYHVPALGPQGGGRALPGVAAIQQQRTRAAGLHAFDQGGQVRKTTHLAVALRRLLKVKVGQRVGLRRASLYAAGAQQVLAHQVRQLAFHAAKAQVDVGLAEINGLELGVAVGHVQERHAAKARDVVQRLGRRGGIGLRMTRQPHTGHGAGPQHLQKFTLGQVHGIVIGCSWWVWWRVRWRRCLLVDRRFRV